MKKININMSESQFKNLTQLCRNSTDEISGIMNIQLNNGEIFIVDIKLDDDDIIKSANSHEIIYNFKEYIIKTVYEIAFSNCPIYIRFHTHPDNGLPNLSETDIDNLKYIQSLTKKVAKINEKDCTKVIEGIVTNSEIAFYTYDLESNKEIRLPFFVDGIEKIPSIEKSIFQIFKESFREGSRKSRK